MTARPNERDNLTRNFPRERGAVTQPRSSEIRRPRENRRDNLTEQLSLFLSAATAMAQLHYLRQWESELAVFDSQRSPDDSREVISVLPNVVSEPKSGGAR
ncbi:MAG: hypothetical protein QF898_10345 [SAR202 cluster bacterium]|jgi:hypothetical protein|nr:hypothetical protein [SAR202 cluster bacterium]MDP6714397.1 hypothetical protein [SAR202 cluster bacterium]